MKHLINKFIKFFVIFTATVVSQFAWAAEVSNSQEASTTTSNSQEKTTSIGTAQDWGLNTQEWDQYQKLMQGADGHWYPQLTPPAILGLNASTAEEQKHYAEIVAKQEHDKVARELAFNNALYAAMRRLYPDEPMIQNFDKTPFNPGNSSIQKTSVLQAGNRLALFVDPQKGMDIAVVPELLAIMQLNKNIILDIYCLGKVDDNAISAWAGLNRIPADLVKTGHITLNGDHGKLAKTAGTVSTPYLLLISDGRSKSISIADL